MVREQACQWALTERQTTLGSGGAPQRGHSASLEPLAQRDDALSRDNKLAAIPVPTNVVVSEPGRSVNTAVSADADRKGEHLGPVRVPVGLLEPSQR